MSESSTAKVRSKAIELITASPNGIRYAQLHQKISEAFPEIPENTVTGGFHKFRINLPPEIHLVAKGLYRHTNFAEPTAGVQVTQIAKIKEEEFYAPFADFLINDLEECTKAIAIGGNRFKDKWGTPDVIGVRMPRHSDIIKPPVEVTAAEIKLDTQGLITAFGQACAYKLFSHRSYIVVPKSSQPEDLERLTALALIFGVGLVFFDSANAVHPGFDIQVRAARNEPDYFYVNQNLKLVEDDLFG